MRVPRGRMLLLTLPIYPRLPARVGAQREGQNQRYHQQARARLAGSLAGDEILTTAILDRLLHHVHIDGLSYRLRELDKLITPPTPLPSNDGGASGSKPRKPGA
jgi:hypothetical protein